MTKPSRLAVIIYPLVIWLLAQTYFVFPELLYIVLAVSIALTLVLTFFLKQPERNTPWWLLAILPVSFLLVITTYISLQPSWILIQLLFLVLAVFLFNYFKSVYYFWRRFDLFKE